MEFAAVNSSKLTAKTVAITLTNEEARNPANAFSALLNLSGNVRFKAENGLTQAESQWMRSQAKHDADPAPKPKAESDTKPKDKVDHNDAASNDDADDVNAAAKSDKTDDTSANDNAGVAATTEAQPAEQTAAVGLEAMQAVAIQFQILVQLPNGAVQDMGTFDLQSLLTAASQDSALASALEAAFGQAADSLAAGQSLLGGVTKNLNLDPALAANLQQAGDVTLDAADNSAISDLFKQIAAAFHPLAQQSTATAAATQVAQTAQATTTATAAAAEAVTDLKSPEAAQQSAELSKIFGEDNKIRVQVSVNGRKVADLPLDLNPFNRFVGYNPETMRTMSTANGQVGQGQVSNATVATATSAAPEAVLPQAVAMASNAGQQANLGAQQNAATGGMPRAEAAPVRAPDAPAPTTTSNASSNSQQSPSTSFANALSQNTGTAAASQTNSPERPAPTQAQQVIEQIKVNITRAAKAGLDRVNIQLRPQELGRIDIKLEMTEQGDVRASVTADNPATLELLQREVRGLERALQDAGLNTDTANLEFNLRSEHDERRAKNEDQPGTSGQQSAEKAVTAEADNENDENYDYTLAANLRGGVDTYA